MRIAILGFGTQGQSAYDYWNKPGNEITICDSNPDTILPDNTDSQLGADYLHDLNRFDLLIRTPILHPRDILAANPEVPDILNKVTTVTNEFIKACPSRNIIGITGTKGKGTTSTLTAKILQAAGKRVHLGGNIGLPPLEMLKGAGALDEGVSKIDKNDWVVLELANFQLIDLKHSPAIAACLMVVPEHLDWHTDMEEYLLAKQQLFRWQSAEDTAIYFAESENSRFIAGESWADTKIPYMQAPGAEIIDETITIDGQAVCRVSDIRLLGQHNWQNVCAAVTIAWQVTKDTKAIGDTITSFSGLEYRLEFIREVDGVKYYNDSFGTTPETAIVAIEAFKEPRIVILGGSDKGADFSALAQAVTDNDVEHVIIIGQTGEKIRKELEALKHRRDVPYSLLGTDVTMDDIVREAHAQAEPGSVVLLSTGCASFDMFKNYKDRGDQFNAAVRAL